MKKLRFIPIFLLALGICSCSSYNLSSFLFSGSFIEEYNNYNYDENNTTDFIYNALYTTDDTLTLIQNIEGRLINITFYSFELYPMNKNDISLIFAVQMQMGFFEENHIYSYNYNDYKLIGNKYIFSGDNIPTDFEFIKGEKNIFRIKIQEEYISLIPDYNKRPLM